MMPRQLLLAIALPIAGCAQILGIEDVPDARPSSGDAGGSDAICAPLPKFGAATRYGIAGVQFTTGNLAGHGLTDVLVVTSADLELLPNKDGGTLDAQRGLIAGMPITGIDGLRVADLDGDSLDDLITWHGTTVTIRRQNTTAPGTFRAAQSFDAASAVSQVVAGKLDNSGLAGLVVQHTAGLSDAITIYLAHAASPGTYDEGATIAGTGINAVFDIDGDDLDDLDCSSIVPGDLVPVEVAFNTPASPGTFTTPMKLGTGGPINAMFGFYTASTTEMAFMLGAAGSDNVAAGADLWVQSSRTFADQTALAVTGVLPDAGRAIDLNGDGRDDLIGTPTGSGSGTVAVQCTSAPGTFFPSSVSEGDVSLPTTGGQTQLVDLNADHRPDLLELDARGSAASMFLTVTLQGAP